MHRRVIKIVRHKTKLTNKQNSNTKRIRNADYKWKTKQEKTSRYMIQIHTLNQ